MPDIVDRIKWDIAEAKGRGGCVTSTADLQAMVDELVAARVDLETVCCIYCEGGQIRRDAPDAAERCAEHIRTCPKHPLGQALRQLEAWRPVVEAAMALATADNSRTTQDASHILLKAVRQLEDTPHA